MAQCKRIKRARLLSIALFFVGIVHSKTVLHISIPKAGTHLCQKLLEELLFEKVTTVDKLGFLPIARFEQVPEQLREVLSGADHIGTHLMYNADLRQVIVDGECLVIFSVRHPLDVLVSWGHFIQTHLRFFPRAQGMSFGEILDDLLDESYVSYHVVPGCCAMPVPPTKGLLGMYQAYLPWITTTNVLTVKFEDLVGPSGGGTLEAQRQAIKSVVQHLGLTLSSESLNQLASKLFGDSKTFRKGQIGSYKSELSSNQLKKGLRLMQPIMGQLGYDF